MPMLLNETAGVLETMHGRRVVQLKEKSRQLLDFLRDVRMIELEIFADQEVSFEEEHCIWINIYGPWLILEPLGRYLENHKVSLQNPAYGNRIVPYYNPQKSPNDVDIISAKQSVSNTYMSILLQDSSTVPSTIERKVEFTKCEEQQTFEEFLALELFGRKEKSRSLWWEIMKRGYEAF